MSIGINHMYARKCEAIAYVDGRGFLKGVGPEDTHPTGGLEPGWLVPLYYYKPKPRRKNKDGMYEFYAIKKTGVKWEVVEKLTEKLHQNN